MKLNGTPRHYMLLSQSQSDDEENGHVKTPELDKPTCTTTDLPKSPKKIPKDDKLGADLKTLPMSPLRTVAFIFSLFLCFAFIFAFVWLLPCKPPVPTIDDVGKIVKRWNFMLNNVSSITTDVIFTNSNSTNSLFLFGYLDNVGASQILAFRKVDGKILWNLNLYSEPTSIVCDKIDVNNDGHMDCLVSGVGNLLTAVDVNKDPGSNMWYIHNHNGIRSADNIKFPVVLTDCDNDLVPDIAVSYVISSTKNIAYLALISGRTGEVIGSLIPLQQCVSPISAQFSVRWLNRTSYLLFCTDGTKGNLWLTQAEEICDIALNRTENIKFKLVYRHSNPLDVVQFKTLFFGEASFAMMINGSKILLFKPNKNRHLKVEWSKLLHKKNKLNNSPWKIISQGNYINKENTELILLRSKDFTSQIVGLSLLDGRQLWSTTFDKLVVSVSELQNFFDNVDGLILKTVYPKNTTQEQYLEATTYQSEDKNEVNIIKEEYILLQGGKRSLTMNISSMEVYQYCNDLHCKSNFHNSKQTAAVITSNRGSVDMAVISMNASSPSASQTYIKLLSFKHLKHPNCLYKLTS